MLFKYIGRRPNKYDFVFKYLKKGKIWILALNEIFFTQIELYLIKRNLF